VQEVAGSNPVSPTSQKKRVSLNDTRFFYFLPESGKQNAEKRQSAPNPKISPPFPIEKYARKRGHSGAGQGMSDL
jgi:hypothetical protein